MVWKKMLNEKKSIKENYEFSRYTVIFFFFLSFALLSLVRSLSLCFNERVYLCGNEVSVNCARALFIIERKLCSFVVVVFWENQKKGVVVLYSQYVQCI